MEKTALLEYKCPCCDAGLVFRGDTRKLTCEYCGNTFELETVKSYEESWQESQPDQVEWDKTEQAQWDSGEMEQLQSFSCPSCGGELLCEAVTAASFCPYCGNPAVLPSRLSGSIRPDGVIPFRKTREDALAAFLKLCKGKPLLPKEFTRQQQTEKLTGIYVPFWLYDCRGDFQGSYRGTRIHRWSDSNYNYTKTDHYLLKRDASAGFAGIPMDASRKMDDTFMESIEPYDYGDLVDFEMGYLTGFLADKYDVEYAAGEERIRQRVDGAFQEQLAATMIGYQTVVPAGRNLQISHSKARYVLMPVWMLNVRYREKTYTFAMNGQTGKMTGRFPICPKRTAAWFSGIFAAAALLTTLVQYLVL